MFKRKNKQTARRSPEYVSKNAPVFSYHSQRSARPEEKAGRYGAPPVQESRGSWWSYAPSLIAGLVVLCCLAYATTLDTSARVLNPETSTTSGLLRTTSEYETEFAAHLGRSIFNRNKFTINTAKIEREIQAEHPELRKVSISLPLLGRRPVIQVEPAAARLILTNTRGSFLIDEDGRALIEAKHARGSLRGLPVLTDESGLEIKKGSIMLPSDNVEFITTVRFQLQAKQMAVQALTLPRTANELHLRLESQPYYVKFNLRAPALSQVGAFLATQERLSAEGSLPSEYIDVRVEDRVYVK